MNFSTKSRGSATFDMRRYPAGYPTVPLLSRCQLGLLPALCKRFQQRSSRLFMSARVLPPEPAPSAVPVRARWQRAIRQVATQQQQQQHASPPSFRGPTSQPSSAASSFRTRGGNRRRGSLSALWSHDNDLGSRLGRELRELGFSAADASKAVQHVVPTMVSGDQHGVGAALYRELVDLSIEWLRVTLPAERLPDLINPSSRQSTLVWTSERNSSRASTSRFSSLFATRRTSSSRLDMTAHHRDSARDSTTSFRQSARESERRSMCESNTSASTSVLTRAKTGRREDTSVLTQLSPSSNPLENLRWYQVHAVGATPQSGSSGPSSCSPSPMHVRRGIPSAAADAAASKQPLRILAIDGGGIMGLNAIVMLRAIEAELGAPLCEYFDLIAGTSAGSAVAAAVAVGGADGLDMAAGETAGAVNMFRSGSLFNLLRTGAKVTPRRQHAYWKSTASACMNRGDETYGAHGCASRAGGVDEYCLPSAGTSLPIRLGGGHDGGRYPMPHVLMTTTRVSRTGEAPQTCLNRNYHNPRAQTEGASDWPLWHALAAGTAAPFYFPDFEGRDGHVYSDGVRARGLKPMSARARAHAYSRRPACPYVSRETQGLLANNPTLLAIEEAMTLWPGRPLSAVISVGTARTELCARALIKHSRVSPRLGYSCPSTVLCLLLR